MNGAYKKLSPKLEYHEKVISNKPILENAKFTKTEIRRDNNTSLEKSNKRLMELR